MGGSAVSLRTIAGYLIGIAVGSMSITLLFFGMRAVMDVGGACAEGGPYPTAQPCPTGVPLAMVAGMLGLFGAAGLIMWFGSRIGGWAPVVVALGWPALFIALGYNFLDHAVHSPDGEPGPVWGWLVPGLLFVLIGLAPAGLAIRDWRGARSGNGSRVSGRANLVTFGAGSAARSRPHVQEEARTVRPTDPAARRVTEAEGAR